MTWIDLRSNVSALIFGDMRTVPQGYWVVIRIMRLGEYSRYWIEERQEAVGGSKYNYDDFCTRVISMPYNALEDGLPVIAGSGHEEADKEIFAIEHNPFFTRYPGVNDIIFKINKFESADVPDPPFIVTDRFKITDPVFDHGDFGRAEVLYMTGVRIHGET